MIMEVDKSKICSVVLQAPDTGEVAKDREAWRAAVHGVSKSGT